MGKSSTLEVAANKRRRKHARILKPFLNHYAKETIELVHQKLKVLGSDAQIQIAIDILEFALHDETGNPFKAGDLFLSYMGCDTQGNPIKRVTKVVRITKNTCYVLGFESIRIYRWGFTISDNKRWITSLWNGKHHSALKKCTPTQLENVSPFMEDGKTVLVVGYYLNDQFQITHRCDFWGRRV